MLRLPSTTERRSRCHAEADLRPLRRRIRRHLRSHTRMKACRVRGHPTNCRTVPAAVEIPQTHRAEIVVHSNRLRKDRSMPQTCCSSGCRAADRPSSHPDLHRDAAGSYRRLFAPPTQSIWRCSYARLFRRFFSPGRFALEQFRKNFSGFSPSAAPIFSAAFLVRGRFPVS